MGFQNAHALIIGIAGYHRVRPLPRVVLADAEAVARVLLDPDLGGYAPDRVRLLRDGQATRGAIRDELAELARVADDRSTVFFFFSGHGGRVADGPAAGDYLLPFDTEYPDEAALASSAIPAAELTAALRAIRARKLVAVLDCCHAGGIGDVKGFAGGLSGGTLERLQAGLGRVVVASSRGSEVSWVRPGDGNSVFTRHLLDGLRGAAPAPDGLVRIFDLFHYLQPRVTAEQPNQHPVLKAEVEENFPVAVRSGPVPVRPAHPTPVEDGYKFDAFVSYSNREPDRSWVRKTFVPRLEAEGVRACIDHRDFRLGRSQIAATEAAVRDSRYTLSVLSPAYLESQLAELGGLLAEYLGAESNQSRWVGILREPCVPRLNLRSRMILDMTDDADLVPNLVRLAFELRQPHPGF